MRLAVLALAMLPFAAAAQPLAITQVRVVDGRGGPPVEGASVVIDNGVIVAAGKGIAIPADARIEPHPGATLMPALISDHSHVGQVGGTATGPQNYTRETVAAQLAQYARYGVTSVVALGNNPPLFDRLRADAHAGRLSGADLWGVDQGIGVPNGGPPQAMLKSAPDQLFRPSTPDEAREAVRRMAAEKTDLVKLWLDDFNRTVPVKMSPDVYRAVIAEAHKLHLRVAAHIHDYADAKAIVDAGVDILAHGVRDRTVPPGFADTLRARGVWYIATLELDEATVAWAERQPWTLTPLARAALSPDLRAQIDDPVWRAKTLADPKAAEAKRALAFNLQNLQTMVAAGVRVGFGTDSGAAPLRVPGIAEHRELALSVQAGLTPLQAITLATQNAAALMNWTDRGVIATGKRADLLLVQGDPSTDIAAADRIVGVWEKGVEVVR